LFFTPNADAFDIDGATVVAYELNDVQPADRVTDVADVFGFETIDFRFGLANNNLSLQEQLNDVRTDEVDIFDFNPGAINQAVEFDSLFGGNLGTADQTITGLDTISTAGGDDFMINIEQDLFIESFNGDDTVTAAFGNDSVSLTVVAGLGDDSVIGGSGADSLIGNAGNDILSGNDGADFIAGDELDGSGTGDDSILSGAGADFVVAGGGNNVVDAGGQDDTVTAGSGNDSILGGSGDDTITAGDGDNTVEGGNGNDTIVTGTGSDSILGGLGADEIFSGDGADFVNGEEDNDLIFGLGGNDSLLSGSGDDTVFGGEGDDLIGFGSTFILDSDGINNAAVSSAFDFVDDDVIFDLSDVVSGGNGFDTLAIALDTTPITLGSDNVEGIEQINVNFTTTDGSLTLDNSILDLVDSNQIIVAVTDDDNGVSFNNTFDATSFVQGESVVFYDSDIEGGRRAFGSGDDSYFNDYVDPTAQLGFGEVTIEGNGGADLIDLSTGSSAERVQFNTGNDGGVAGASTGGDTIRNFNQDDDLIIISGDPGDGGQASGLIFDLTQKQATLLPIGDPAAASVLQAVENTKLTLGGLIAEDFNVGTAGGSITGLAQNMLFLTGPAKSLTDAEITDAAAVVQAINNLGVQGNGLSFGDQLPLNTDYQISQQTNQALIVQQGQTDTAVWLYVESSFEFNNEIEYTAQTDELRLLGTFEDVLLNQDDFITNQGITVA
jgi:hypothetical protein